MFPSPSILQNYIEFDIRTMVILEKLFGARSFGGFISYLDCHQAIIPTFLGGLDLLSMVQIAAPAFLGCWALIVPTFVIHFQHDDHPIILGVLGHVETGTS
jgi:hypothetical protein